MADEKRDCSKVGEVNSNALMAKVAAIVTEIAQLDKIGRLDGMHKVNSAYDKALGDFECDRLNAIRQKLMEYASVTNSQFKLAVNLSTQFDRLVNANDVFQERIVTLVDAISGKDLKQVSVLERGAKKAPKTRAQWNKPIPIEPNRLDEDDNETDVAKSVCSGGGSKGSDIRDIRNLLEAS